jgi:hypothetical protein
MQGPTPESEFALAPEDICHDMRIALRINVISSHRVYHYYYIQLY